MVLENERQFHPPDVAPLYPTLLDSCSPLTSPPKNQHPKVRRKYHYRGGNDGCVIQYGINASQIPGTMPHQGHHCHTKLIVKVSSHQEDKNLAQKNYNHYRRRRKSFIEPSSPSKMFIGKLTKSHRSWRDNNNAKNNNINEYCDRKPIRTLGNMFQEMGQSKDNSIENESSTKSESQSGTESSHINTVVEIHKCDSKRKKCDKRHYDNNDVDKMNEKNSNGTQTEKNDNQKIEFSKFRRQTMKLKNMFVPGMKESQESSTNNKDLEKAEEFVPTKKLKQSKISDDDKDSEFSRIEEISEDSSTDRISKKSYQNPRRLIFKSNQNDNENQIDQKKSETPNNKSVGVQATPFPPFRLHFLPEEDWRETENKLHKLLKIVLCQCGLACIVLTWAMLGALVFRLTEGPQEQRQVQEMARQQASLVVGLATDLRQVVPQEPIWRQTIERYANQHEALILSAVSSGYPQRGTIWTYPGSLLFATSLLTTLGFGAPVPRTVVGRMSAIIFAGLGIPMHLLLILNIGLLIVVKLTRLAYICQGKMKFLKFKIHKVKTRGDSEQNSTPEWPNELFVSEKQTPPTWLKYFPFVAIPTYYLTGFLLFGVARGKQFPEVFLFPLDFTAAGGVASTYGPLRIAYAMYLEGAVILASTNVALLRVSATRGFTTAAIKLGLMTNLLH